jgi:hypothetical protein
MPFSVSELTEMFLMCKEIKQVFKAIAFTIYLRSQYSQGLKSTNEMRKTSRFGRTGDKNHFQSIIEYRDFMGSHHSGDKKSVNSYYSYERGSFQKGPKRISE